MPRSRATRIAIAIAALIAAQGAAIAVYLAVEGSRDDDDEERFRVEELRGEARAPDLVLERNDGTRVSLGDIPGPLRLVHFWATWCPPCVDELPGLLATARALEDDGLTLIAISMDEGWEDIRAFFGGDVPGGVYRAVAPDAHERFDVVTLPDTYLVAGDGRLQVRYGGARTWDSRRARDHLARELRRAAPPR